MQYQKRHQRWQLCDLNFLKNTLVKSLPFSVILTLNHPVLSRLLHLFFVHSKCLSKLTLTLLPLILFPYSVNAKALSSFSATTVKSIQGSKPYFTFDNGVTKITTTEGLLGITLSDGTRITPANNTSATTPIVLPNTGDTLANVQMLVPATADYIDLSTLIDAPYNYWGDDDGDGQGTNGVTATGSLSVSITDKYNQTVSRSATLDICHAPYKVVLTSTDGSLTTQYGLPNSSNFSASSATYYINPNAASKICYLYTPNAAQDKGVFAGPANIWTPGKGFLPQSTEPSTYSSNFPTTGANNLYFDLDIGGINGSTLTWPTVTHGGITATMTATASNSNNIRVTITGPSATITQQNSVSPDSIPTPSLPQQFELIGYDSNHTAVVKYGFVLKQWFVNRGNKYDVDNLPDNLASWCTSLNKGYHLPHVKDLTNAIGAVTGGGTWIGGTPPSKTNSYQRNIGAGFFAEWGRTKNYIGAGFVDNYYLTSDADKVASHLQFNVNSVIGGVVSNSPNLTYYGVCTYP